MLLLAMSAFDYDKCLNHKANANLYYTSLLKKIQSLKTFEKYRMTHLLVLFSISLMLSIACVFWTNYLYR